MLDYRKAGWFGWLGWGGWAALSLLGCGLADRWLAGWLMTGRLAVWVLAGWPPEPLTTHAKYCKLAKIHQDK